MNETTESNQNLTINDTVETGCFERLKRRLKQSEKVGVNNLVRIQEEAKRPRRADNALFLYIEALNKPKDTHDTSKEIETKDVLKVVDKYRFEKSQIRYQDVFNYKNEYDCNVLHEVCRIKNSSKINALEIYKSLRENSLTNVITNKYGQTILHVASYYDNYELAKYIIENETNTEEEIKELIDAKTYEENQTALHYAVKQGNYEIVDLLLRCNANIEERDYQHRTPLYLACEHGHANLAEYLIEKNACIEVDNYYGQKCLYWIIAKCPNLASNVLNKYKKFNVYTKKDTYNLKYVELDPGNVGRKITEKESQAKSILTLIVETHNLDLITHPVIARLVKVKWDQFGKKRCWFDFVSTIVYLVVWNLIGVLVPFDQRYKYTFPHDGWRVFLFILGFIGMVVLVFIELRDLYFISKYNERVKNHRFKELEGYGKFFYFQPNQIDFWSEENKTLRNTQLFMPYVKDFWNWFDIISIILLCASIITHLVDISDHTEENARIHIRILSVSIIFISMRLLKVGRVLYEEFGQLVMTLYFVNADIFVWLVTYCIIWIPFTTAFWILFGGSQSKVFNPDTNSTVQISGFDFYNNAAFNMYRLTFGVDLDRDNLVLSDNVLTDPLIGCYLGFTSLIAVNLFIALLTSTFNRVHDQSRAYFIMQRAAELLKHEHKMEHKNYKQHLESFKKSYEDSKVKTNSLKTDIDDVKVSLIQDTMKTIRSKTNELDVKLNELNIKLEQNTPINDIIESSRKIETNENKVIDIKTVQNEFDDLKLLLSSFLEKNKAEKNESYTLTRVTPKVDVLRINALNESQISISGIEDETISPVGDSSET